MQKFAHEQVLQSLSDLFNRLQNPASIIAIPDKDNHLFYGFAAPADIQH